MCCKSPKVLCVCSIIFFVLTAIFVGLAIGIPIYLQSYIQKEARQGVQLRQDNFYDWRELPGKNDIKVYRDYKLYNCNNTMDIYFNSAKPICYETPPVTFYENQLYTNATFSKMQVPDYPERKRDAVKAQYYLNQIQVSDDTVLNQTISVANQALFGVWYGASHQTTFGLAYAGLWNAFDGLQTTLVNQFAITSLTKIYPRYMSQNGFNDALPDDNFSQIQKDQLWGDVNYGFSNQNPVSQINNVLKWMEICPDFGKTEKQQLARKFDIKRYFGLNKQQMTDLKTDLCDNDLVQAYKIVKIIGGDTPDFKQQVAYAQWSSSMITQQNDPPADSVVQVDPSLAGYPQMSYFLKSRFEAYLNNSKIYEKQFSSINFLNNYSYLFATSGSDGKIPKNSLFYYSTMESLINTGQKYNATSNIKNDTLVLDAFKESMATLNLPDLQHTYVLYAYLKILAEEAVVRSDKGGYPQAVGLANFASAGLSGIMDSLFTYTLPRALYGIMTLISNGADITNCTKIAQKYFNSPNVQSVVCSVPSLKINSIGGIYFWVQAYEAITKQITDVLQQVGISEKLLTDFLEESGNFGTALDNAMQAVKSNYYNTTGGNQTACTITGSNSKYCSDTELGYSQFLSGNITNNLPPQISLLIPQVQNTPTIAGFAALLGQQIVPPEYSSFLKMINKSNDLNGITVQDVFGNYTTNLTNLGVIQKQFIYQNTTVVPFDTDAWRDYLRYVIIEFAFNGLFLKKTVREVLFGYEDDLIKTVIDTPVYEGGDPTQNPLLQVIEPLSQTDLAFFTGVGDSNYTQVYAEYNNSPDIMIYQNVRINDGTQAMKTLVNPWRQTVSLKGTDASKFRPLLDTDDNIWAFVSDLMLPLRFLFSKDQEKDGLQLYKYILDQQMLQTSDKYPPNKAYYIDEYEGFGNLTSIRGAKIFASQAHFYDVPPELDDIKSIIKNSTDDSQILPSDDNDLSYFKLQKYSGGAVEGQQKITLNAFTENDVLFNMTTANNGFNYMIPVAYVTRRTQLSDDQIEDLFGALKLGLKLKLALLITLPILAGIFFALAITLLICRRKRLRNASYTRVVG